MSSSNKVKPTNTNTVSRRAFLGYAGGFAGLAALSSFGLNEGWGTNKISQEIPKTSKTFQTDVLVIGSGMAGLFAAVKAHDAGAKTILASKGRLGASGQTPFAKGIFEYDSSHENLSVDEFVAAISHSAIDTNNAVYTRQLAVHSKDRVNELREWGFFNSSLCNKSFSHPINQRKISLHERVIFTHLIKENGKITGAAGFDQESGNVQVFHAKSVILCTGAGGFKPNGFPICDLTHDGTAMAYRIGAKITGKEWNDGHPGNAENPAACYDGWHGMFEQKPSTTSIGIRHDLGVDMNYSTYMQGPGQMMGPPVRGGFENVSGGPQRPEGLNMSGPPQGDEGEHKHDGPPPKGRGERKGPPPGGRGDKGDRPPGMNRQVVGGSSAGMSIHKSEGLVPINEFCETNIPGLYAAGDALGSHMAGGIYTQIGSSLAGSAVQGAIAGERAASYAGEQPNTEISSATIAKTKEAILAPMKRDSGYSPAWVTQTLQGIMVPNFILYIKREKMMQAALAFIEELRDQHIPMLRASDAHELRLAHETENMLLNAEMKLKASIMRKESRCSHYRLDYPEMDDTNWRAWINIHQGDDGSMQLEKQSFGTWPDGTKFAV